MKTPLFTRALRFGIGTCARRPGELRYLFAYLGSMIALSKSDDGSVLGSELPWVSYRMVAFLEKILDADKIVFEYGSGGSTLFFAGRVGAIVSVEHDAHFFDYVQEMLNQRGIKNCTQVLLPPDHEPDRREYESSLPAYKGQSFERYVKAIRAYPDRYFDIVFVDGRARSQCMWEGADKVRDDGYLILDNASRERYQTAVKDLVAHGWSRLDIDGLTPYSLGWDVTSVFRRSGRIPKGD